MGNAVFLEAHAQNSVHFSQASQSSSLLRIGELSLAMLLQTVFPLMLFFLGYRSVVLEREQGTLKLAMVQGVRLPSLVLGKTLGLFVLGLIFLLPILLGWSLLGWLHSYEHWVLGWSFGLLAGGYLLYTLLLCLVCVWVSYRSRTSRTALIRLVGVWILAVILIPKSVQSLGRSLYPAPNTFAFYSELSREINAVGNSHNPNDPYFSALRDSVLQVHQVDKITELPFNYGGFIMREGEKLSARIYDRHHQQLLDIYREQNSLTRRFSWIDPYLSLQLFSRILARSDFETYTAFKNQAEAYRYQMAQRMNQLQMDLISSQRPSGSEGRIHVVSRDHWKALPDFKYQFASEKEVLQKASGFVWVLLFWNVFALFGLLLSTNKPIDL